MLRRLRVLRFECDSDDAGVLLPGARCNEAEERQQEQRPSNDIDNADAAEFPARYASLWCVAGLLYFDREVSPAWNLVLKGGRAGEGAVDQYIGSRGIRIHRQ